ncbi:sulfotransferase [Novosphingobium sp. BL-8H]|uniref:sulfotransferase n=1 Tax=Novosphingobium sp. BL-8H TaxID=3127640 RepID=UPI0037573AB1
MKSRINKLLKPLGYELDQLDERPYWPRARAKRIDRPFLFLLTPAGSGSADIAWYMSRRSDIGGLHHSFEGQRLVKGLMDSDRWWPEKFVDYEAVLGAWSRRIAEADPEGRYAWWLEKSPANMVRHRQLLEYFPNHRVVVNNRGPVANVAAQVRRYLFKEYHGAHRPLVVRHLARIWLWRSRLLMQAVRDHGYPCLSYEAFCRRPAAIAEAFGLEPLPLVGGDDMPPGAISSSGARTGPDTARQLTEHEREMVVDELSGASEVLQFFGYDLATELAAEDGGEIGEPHLRAVAADGSRSGDAGAPS